MVSQPPFKFHTSASQLSLKIHIFICSYKRNTLQVEMMSPFGFPQLAPPPSFPAMPIISPFTHLLNYKQGVTLSSPLTSFLSESISLSSRLSPPHFVFPNRISLLLSFPPIHPLHDHAKAQISLYYSQRYL